MERMDDLVRRVASLELQLKEEREAVKPIIDFWNASKIIGKIFFIIGSMITGTIVAISSFGDYIMRHWK